MLVSALKPTDEFTLNWNPLLLQDDFTSFINKLSFEQPGFVAGLHPVVNGDIKQVPAHLKRFFNQLRVAMETLEDLDDVSGELYLTSDKIRKPITDEMVKHIQFEDGVWAPDCPRVEGRVEFMGVGNEIDYRDMTFLFSNFGDQFETSLDELLHPGDLAFIPPGLRLRKFKNVEFLIQVISKCVNSLSFPAKLTYPESPEKTSRAYEEFESDCLEFGFPLVLPKNGNQAEERLLVRGFNEHLMLKACMAGTDQEVKRFGQRFKLDTEAYFKLTRGTPMPVDGRTALQAHFGLNEKMQAAGFLIRTRLNKDFKDLFYNFIDMGVLVGEAATYNRGGRLMPDLNWGGDFGYQFAPHQEYLLDGNSPVYYDAMRVGYCAACSMMVQTEEDFPFVGYEQYREMMGHPVSIDEAIRNLLKSVILDPLAPTP